MSDLVVGETVLVAIEQTTPEENAELGWVRSATVLRFSNGLRVFPSRDDEGNGPGTLFTEQNGECGYLLYQDQ